MEKPNPNILERIHASYYAFTATERKVADFVLTHLPQIEFMSITQLADECGTAEASISRFCRRLKLTGFNAFKLEVAKYSASSAAPYPTADSSDTMEGRIAQVASLANEAVRQTMELVDQAQVRRAVNLIENASRVICMGAGGSMILANECAHLFSTVTGKFLAVSDSHSQMSAAATMEERDVILLFSYSGATTSGIQVLELARSRNIPTILITRFRKSPAANLADVVLRCGSNEGPLQFGSVPAKIAQLVAVDILFQEYYHQNRSVCEKNIEAIAAALSGKHI